MKNINENGWTTNYYEELDFDGEYKILSALQM